MTTVRDPKATIVATYNWILGNVSTCFHTLPCPSFPRPPFSSVQLTLTIKYIQDTSILIMLFYDSPTPPPGIFDDFLAIPQHSSDLGNRGMASMAKAGNYSAMITGHR